MISKETAYKKLETLHSYLQEEASTDIDDEYWQTVFSLLEQAREFFFQKDEDEPEIWVLTRRPGQHILGYVEEMQENVPAPEEPEIWVLLFRQGKSSPLTFVNISDNAEALMELVQQSVNQDIEWEQDRRFNQYIAAVGRVHQSSFIVRRVNIYMPEEG